LKEKGIYKTFIKSFIKSEKDFIKKHAAISMTSAISKLVGRYWAGRVSGPKVAQQIWPNWPRG
jgi:hypothetical protein